MAPVKDKENSHMHKVEVSEVRETRHCEVGVWKKAEEEALMEIHIQNKLSGFLPMPPTHTENSSAS